MYFIVSKRVELSHVLRGEEVFIMDMAFIRARITALRMKKGVSEYRMSLELGHSRSYIQNIVSGRTNPALEEFLYICDYLGVSPRAFFDPDDPCPDETQHVLETMQALSTRDRRMVQALADRLAEKGE